VTLIAFALLAGLMGWESLRPKRLTVTTMKRITNDGVSR
jgi:hypothetical protein